MRAARQCRGHSQRAKLMWPAKRITMEVNPAPSNPGTNTEYIQCALRTVFQISVLPPVNVTPGKAPPRGLDLGRSDVCWADLGKSSPVLRTPVS
jgi:hypothetical protein